MRLKIRVISYIFGRPYLIPMRDNIQSLFMRRSVPSLIKYFFSVPYRISSPMCFGGATAQRDTRTDTKFGGSITRQFQINRNGWRNKGRTSWEEITLIDYSKWELYFLLPVWWVEEFDRWYPVKMYIFIFPFTDFIPSISDTDTFL